MWRPLAVAALAVMLAACGDDATGDDDGTLLVLGDSIAAGIGAADPATGGWAALLASERGMHLRNLAVPGATTEGIIDDQLSAALSEIEGGSVRIIAVSAGGNDLAALIPNESCVDDPVPASCPLDASIEGVEGRLDRIVRELRAAAGEETVIVLLAYPNFFAATGHAFEAPAARVLPRVGEAVARVAERHGARVATPSFEGRGDELTGVLAETFDPHPNDAGHRVIASAFDQALD
jgi:lysophospholipase L1-like esterase